jgi:hypothetical protein
LMGIDLSRPSTGTIDCAVAPQKGERETLVIAQVCAVVPAVVAMGRARIRRLALAGTRATVSASVVVVSLRLRHDGQPRVLTERRSRPLSEEWLG